LIITVSFCLRVSPLDAMLPLDFDELCPPPSSFLDVMSSSNPLATLSSLIDTSTPHLASLHKALDLPADALKQDLGRLEAILRKELEGLVGEREKEVKEWNGKVQAVEQGELRVRERMKSKTRYASWKEAR
jgi:hypothetical protein